MSPRTIRPPASLPRTLDRSMRSSRASRRTDGEATGAATGFGNSSPASAAGSSAEASGSGSGAARFAAGAAAAGSSPPLNEIRRWPTLILSPDLTYIFATTPAAVDGMDATAFSFSNSRMAWSLATWSPSFTKTLTTTPESAPSPSLGSLTSIINRGTNWRIILRFSRNKFRLASMRTFF